MKSALVFLALVALSQGLPFQRSLDGRIVNGDDAEVGEIPYQISLQTTYGFHFCGGSILNQNYVITAAHCVEGTSPANVKVIAGTTDLDDPRSTHPVAEIIVHAKYNPQDSWVNDIALIRVTKEFTFSKTVSPVPLPKNAEPVPDYSPAVVSGWGSIEEGGAGSRVLQRTNVMTRSHEDCREAYNGNYKIHNTHICANDPTVVTGSCHGDSGGPLTVKGTLVGLVSWAAGCASTKYPTVYTRVSEYIDWINSHTV